MLAATIFMCVFVIIGGVVLYLSRTIDAGEARFDTREHDDETPDES
jgi:fructose-specific phosphotransferase system IIC component